MKKKIFGVIIILAVGFFIQFASYYGGYLEKHYNGHSKSESWNLVFKETFQTVPGAIGSHLPIIIAVVVVIVKYKKEKTVNDKVLNKKKEYDGDELKELDRKNKKLLIILGIMVAIILLMFLIAAIIPNNDDNSSDEEEKIVGCEYTKSLDVSTIEVIAQSAAGCGDVFSQPSADLMYRIVDNNIGDTYQVNYKLLPSTDECIIWYNVTLNDGTAGFIWGGSMYVKEK